MLRVARTRAAPAREQGKAMSTQKIEIHIEHVGEQVRVVTALAREGHSRVVGLGEAGRQRACAGRGTDGTELALARSLESLAHRLSESVEDDVYAAVVD